MIVDSGIAPLVAGVFAGAVLGFVARRQHFCTMGSLERHWYAGDSSGLRTWALAILSAASAVIAEGEVWQLAAAKQMTTSEADYLAVIDAKTAALFSAATEVGPVIAGKGEEERAAMRDYGRSLGLAFQLVDDVLDYRGSLADLGKNTGDDFREGKITLPVILAYAQGDAAEKAFWQSAMESGDNDEAALSRAKELLQRHGALEATIERARDFGEEAYRAAATLPPSPAREAMLGVVDFCVDRLN